MSSCWTKILFLPWKKFLVTSGTGFPGTGNDFVRSATVPSCVIAPRIFRSIPIWMISVPGSLNCSPTANPYCRQNAMFFSFRVFR